MICPICNMQHFKNIFNLFDDDAICWECHKKFVIYRKNEKIKFEYQGHIKDLIHRIKFKGDFQAAKFIGSTLKEYIPKGWVVSFPPSSKKDTKERGFIPMEEVAKSMNIPYEILFDKTSDYSNHKLKSTERKDDIILIKKPPKKVFLIDDVMTSGKTIQKCINILKKSGSRVEYYIFSKNSHSVV